MKMNFTTTALACVLTLSVAVGAEFDTTKVADAKPGDLRVIASGAIELPLKKVIKHAQSAVGKPLIVQYGGSQLLKADILKGQDSELVILTVEANEDLRNAGRIGQQKYEVARVPIGFGLRGDVPAPDVSNPAAVKAALLKAKSVKYAPTGAAIQTVHNILTKLDLAGKLQDTSASKEPAALAAGEYEIDIYPLSEILAKKAVMKSLGPVIPELQVASIVEAGIGQHANDPKAAMAFIHFLQGPEFAAALRETGLQPGRAGKSL